MNGFKSQNLCLNSVLNYFENNAKLLWPSISENAKRNPDTFERYGSELTQWAQTLLGTGFEQALCEGYRYFSADVGKAQVRYEKAGHYPYQTYEEVFQKTYNNQTHMEKYHWGVFTTHFAWEHHLHILAFYHDRFLSLLKKENPGRLIDLGSGSGIWSISARNTLDAWSISGVDISETSVALAQQLAQSLHLEKDVQFQTEDALHYSESQLFDAGVSCYVLEHLEIPVLLFENLEKNIKPGGYAFVTAALTAAEIDHIAEFRRESEIILLAEEAGFRVVDMLSAATPYYSSKKQFLPRSMAIVLQKRHNEIW